MRDLLLLSVLRLPLRLDPLHHPLQVVTALPRVPRPFKLLSIIVFLIVGYEGLEVIESSSVLL